MPKSKPQTMDDYIATFPKDVQNKLQNIRKTIRKAIPHAEENLKWNRPAFVDERILVMFAAFKNHIGFYSTPSSLENFQEELKDFKTGSGSVQLPHNQPLPVDLIQKITKYRDWESREKNVNWKS